MNMSDIGGISCSVEIEGHWDFCDIKDVKARKPHRCCECHETINPGQIYERVSGHYDGQFMSYRTCMSCKRIRNDLCRTYYYGFVVEQIWECYGVNYLTGEVQSDDWGPDPDVYA